MNDMPVNGTGELVCYQFGCKNRTVYMQVALKVMLPFLAHNVRGVNGIAIEVKSFFH